jgi:flagellar biogenesis protein FliO
MRNPFLAACLTLLISLPAAAQPATEFAETAPPKVAVPLPDASPAVHDPEAAAPPPEGPAADPLISEIGALMDVPPNGEDATAPEASGASAGDDTAFSPARAALNALMALCAVLFLFFLLVYLAKRFGKRTPILAGQQLGKVLGRVALSPQASLHFVQTNGEVLVIGVTTQSVSLLRSFDAAEFGQRDSEPAAPQAANTRNFLDQLKEVQHSMAGVPGVDEDLDSLKGDLQRLKQYFQDSTRDRG